MKDLQKEFFLYQRKFVRCFLPSVYKVFNDKSPEYLAENHDPFGPCYTWYAENQIWFKSNYMWWTISLKQTSEKNKKNQ